MGDDTRQCCGPEVIEYLKTPPDRETISGLIAAMQITPRQLLRERSAPYQGMRLADASLSDDALIAAMLTHPILINRPIAVNTKGVRLCRLSEMVLEILENSSIGVFAKEDGEVFKPLSDAYCRLTV